MNTTLSQEELENLARKRAAARMSWYIHALVFIALNTVFAAASLFTGHHWAVFPAFGWGLGLMIHGLVVFMALPGSGLHERLLQQERQKLATQRDPW
ncbi:2TM domain-containing protein [Polaromonas sp.]|uniref:2TM domain-containing protein n=1 Tax=Polaromonas sp. TaxID=1869339 RepID=UPI002FC7A8AC